MFVFVAVNPDVDEMALWDEMEPHWSSTDMDEGVRASKSSLDPYKSPVWVSYNDLTTTSP